MTPKYTFNINFKIKIIKHEEGAMNSHPDNKLGRSDWYTGWS